MTIHAETAPTSSPSPEAGDTLSGLIQFIVATHHAFTRGELRRVAVLFGEVVEQDGGAYLELGEIGACVEALAADLGPHLLKEENILFPYLEALEHAHKAGLPEPVACFGTLENPLRQMNSEHEAVGGLLERLRELTRDFTPPHSASPAHRAFYQALEGLEADLIRHIHLENQVLFPRARQLAA